MKNLTCPSHHPPYYVRSYCFPELQADLPRSGVNKKQHPTCCGSQMALERLWNQRFVVRLRFSFFLLCSFAVLTFDLTFADHPPPQSLQNHKTHGPDSETLSVPSSNCIWRACRMSSACAISLSCVYIHVTLDCNEIKGLSLEYSGNLQLIKLQDLKDQRLSNQIVTFNEARHARLV